MNYFKFLLVFIVTGLVTVRVSSHPANSIALVEIDDVNPSKMAVLLEIPTDTLRGIDVSHWNKEEVEKLKSKDRITFVVCKATQGESSVDPLFRENLKYINEKKYVSGVYHFYSIGVDPIAQANHFWKTVTEAKGTIDITPIVDIEQPTLSSKTLPKEKKIIQAGLKTLPRDLQKFLDELEKLSGRVPMIYTATVFANQYLKSPNFSKYRLWLAEYTKAKAPTVPKAWKKTGWTIWQKSASYKMEGDSVDFDIFYGTKADLVK